MRAFLINSIADDAGVTPAPAEYGRPKSFLLATVVLYYVVIGIFIAWCDFIPYGTDNNETFSSLLHARNMAQQGLFSFFGLTNETASSAQEAQAFLYTHQGNFPRFFAYILYVIGAQTAAAQIAWTAGTVGALGISLAYRFIERHATPLFAFIFCAFLITDYVMSLQWLVNTWRVWHLFFFFAALLLADRIIANRRIGFVWGAMTVLTFAALSYFEMTYAAFVSFLIGAYLGIKLWREPSRLFKGWMLCGAGVLAGLAVLVAQIVGQFGWDTFLKDLTYTYLSRNDLPHDKALQFRDGVRQFMREHNIVFWDNFAFIRGGLHNLLATLKVFFRYNLLPISPPIVTIGAICIICALARFAADYPKINARYFEIAQADIAQTLVLPAFVFFGALVIASSRAVGLSDPALSLIGTGASFPFALWSVAVCGLILYFVQQKPNQLPPAAILVVSVAVLYVAATIISPWHRPAALGIAGVVLIVLTCLLQRQLLRLEVSRSRATAACAALVLCGLYVHFSAYYYRAGLSLPPHFYDPFVVRLIEGFGGNALYKLSILSAGALGAMVTLGWLPSLPISCFLSPSAASLPIY